MKVWVKLLFGALLGIALGFLLPDDNPGLVNLLGWLEGFAIQIGRYAILPVLLFSLTIGIYELREDGRFWPLVGRSLVLMTCCTLLVIVAGIGVTTLFPPGRIPIVIEERAEQITLELSAGVLDLFPSNMFSAIISNGVYLLPLCVFAYFLAIGLSYDRTYTKPVIALIDSLSRIFYYIMALISELLSPVLIILSAYWAIRYRAVISLGIYQNLMLLLGGTAGLLGFGILPLFLYALRPKTNPWAVLYGSLGPALGAFFSRDINFTLPILLRHVKENLGVRRRVNTLTLSLFATFGRAGSAMVAAISFIVIVKSYSSLGVTFADLISIGVRAFLISFLLARHSADAAYTALTVLCLWFGRGFEGGYLILKPLAFYLITIGTFLDVMIGSYAAYALAKLSGFQEEDKRPGHFI